MINLNKVTLIGRITKEIELKSLPSGVFVANMSIATNRTWKDANGQKQEATEFHNVIAFGKQAETLKQYVVKGQELYIEGRLQTRSWDDNDGKKRYATEIVLENFQFGAKPKGIENSNEQPVEQSEEKSFDQQVDEINYPDEEINLEDIPF